MQALFYMKWDIYHLTFYQISENHLKIWHYFLRTRLHDNLNRVKSSNDLNISIFILVQRQTLISQSLMVILIIGVTKENYLTWLIHGLLTVYDQILS